MMSKNLEKTFKPGSPSFHSFFCRVREALNKSGCSDLRQEMSLAGKKRTGIRFPYTFLTKASGELCLEDEPGGIYSEVPQPIFITTYILELLLPVICRIYQGTHMLP